MNKILMGLSLIAPLAAVACGGAIRQPDQYRDDTAKVLQMQANPKIQTCFQGLVSSSAAPGGLAGNTQVHFWVAKDTGLINNPTIVAGGTTTTDPVNQCVLTGLAGAKLDPPDSVDGDATFAWQFVVQPAGSPGSPPPPMH
jgi:hypothetical protein